MFCGAFPNKKTHLEWKGRISDEYGIASSINRRKLIALNCSSVAKQHTNLHLRRGFSCPCILLAHHILSATSSFRSNDASHALSL